MRYIGTTPNPYGDTLLTSDADDQINVKVGGAEDFRISSNTLSVLSGTTLNIDSGATIANSGTATGFGSGLASGDVIPADDGSVGAPGISFADDTDNGMYRIGTNNVGISTAGALALDIDASGRVFKPLQPQFFALITTIQYNVTGDSSAYIFPFDSTYYDVGSNFDTTNYYYVTPVAGMYAFSAGAMIRGLTTNHDNCFFYILPSATTGYAAANPVYGEIQNFGAMMTTTNQCVKGAATIIAHFPAGAQVSLYLRAEGGAKVVDIYGAGYPCTWMSGCLLA